MKKIRIFLSSPGDVWQERNIARNVISQLSSLYAQYVELEILMWEDLPLSADSTFQEGIDYFIKGEEIDIAVFILWSRLGTPLCTKFTKPDGSLYKSGTEYEFDLMMRLFEEKGKPRILTYVKNTEQLPTVKSLGELEEILHQKDCVKMFLQEHFRDDESNSNYAYMQFGENASFEQKFRLHISKAIKSILGDIDEIKEWNGNPYVGLNSFDFDQSQIFFGRRQLIYDTASRLIDIDRDKEKKSLIVLGESGSGKSSFVKAGLLPFFCGDVEQSCRYVILLPSSYGGKIYSGLLDLLKEKFDFLRDVPFIEELAEEIDRKKNFKNLSYAFDQNEYEDLIIYIDQFEELFTDNNISEEERTKVLMLLRGIISIKKIRVFLSMRSDFYSRFSLYSDLLGIKEMSEVVDLPVPGYSEIEEIVEEPARKACLKWEIDELGNGLNKMIVEEASEIKDLPLIEFALSELYNLRDSNDCLTFEAYQKIGGLNGAIGTYADAFYSKLNDSEKQVFEDIVSFVVVASASQEGVYAKKTSLRKDAEKTELHAAVVDKLIDAHLLVSGRDAFGEATITLAHEILMTSWTTLSDWMIREMEFLKKNTYFEQKVQYWTASNRSSKDLEKGRTPLLEAEYHLFKYGRRLSTEVSDYLTASLKKERKRGLVWRIIAFVLLVLSLAVVVVSKLSGYSLDGDFESWTGLNQPGGVAMMLLIVGGILLFPLLVSILHKGRAKPYYKTALSDMICWTIVFALTLFLVFYPSINWLFAVISMLPVTILWINKVNEWYRRKIWVESYRGYRFSDDFTYKLKSISVSVFVALCVLSTSAMYYGVLLTKEEKIEKIADMLSGQIAIIDMVRAEMSPADNNSLDWLRVQDLEDRFWEEITDTNLVDYFTDGMSIDPKLLYAKSLYNLNYPENAMRALEPDYNWHHHFLYIQSVAKTGDYDFAMQVLEPYVEDGRYDEVGQSTTADFIWLAEKAGRFDIAGRIYDILRDTVPENLNNPALLINRAHIYLTERDYDSASVYYNKGIESFILEGLDAGLDYKTTEDFIKNTISQDFHTLSRQNVINDDMLDSVSKMLGIEFVPAYITVHQLDTALNEAVCEKLAGDWIMVVDSTCTKLSVDENLHLFRYEYYDVAENYLGGDLTEGRFAYMDDGSLYWDEFSLISDGNALYRIININENSFEIESVGLQSDMVCRFVRDSGSDIESGQILDSSLQIQ